jgi:hypothetical protein
MGEIYHEALPCVAGDVGVRVRLSAVRPHDAAGVFPLWSLIRQVDFVAFQATSGGRMVPLVALL